MRDHLEPIEEQSHSGHDCPTANWLLQRSLVVKTVFDSHDLTIYGDAEAMARIALPPGGTSLRVYGSYPISSIIRLACSVRSLYARRRRLL